MSNNPFLKNKNKDNNRFHFLNDEQPFKNVNNKQFDENRNRNRNCSNNNNNYNNNRIDNNRFKSISSSEQPKMNVDIDNIISFPTLINTKECETTVNTSSKFKDILNTDFKEDVIENKNIIPPGWLQLTMLNGKVSKNEYKDINEKDIEEQEQINYNMYKIGKALQTNYELYEKEYDSINGEGSYDYNFRLSPVYGSEYDSNSESEDYDKDGDDYDYEYEN